MTTVAYRDGVLAGDTRATISDTTLPEVHRKVRRLRSGHLLGWSGSIVAATKLVSELQADGNARPIIKGVSAILISPNGAVEEYCEGWMPVRGRFNAIGSGRDFALAAMMCGKSAKEAVRIACKLDTHSGGRVLSVELRRPDDRRKQPAKVQRATDAGDAAGHPHPSGTAG